MCVRVKRKQRVKRFNRSRLGLRRNTEDREVRRHGEYSGGFGMIVGTILPCPPYTVLSESNKCEEEIERRKGHND